MDKVYGLLFILFVLSQISERIANFLKLKLSDTRLMLKAGDNWFKRNLSFGNTKVKSNDQELEKDREFRILKINIATGIFIALSFRTDLFTIISNIDNPTAHIGWVNIGTDFKAFNAVITCDPVAVILFGLELLVGCIITGVFISFGSKFWHDILDLVLQAKNFRSMMTQKGLDEMQNSFSALDYNTQENLMDAAINENFDTWKNVFPNIIGATSGLKRTESQELPQNAIVFKVDGKTPSDQLQRSEVIPKEILYRGFRIPTDVVDSEPVLSMIRYSGANEVPSSIGFNVSLGEFENYGTAALKVQKDGNNYLLSCFHVLGTFKLREVTDISKGIECHNFLDRPECRISIPSGNFLRDNPGAASLEGIFTDGVLTNEVDAAIAKIAQGDLLNQTFFDDNNQSFTVSGEFPYDQLAKGLKVETFGCVSGHRTGTVTDIKAQKTIVRIAGPGYAFKFTFNKLIELACPCLDGDSGAPAMTADGRVIGIVIAGNSKQTFIVPFPFIKTALNIELI